MKYEQYTALIKRLEKFAAEKPSTYRTYVVSLALAGYAYFALILSLALAFPLGLAALVWFYPAILLLLLKLGKGAIVVAVFAILALGFVWSVMSALWFKIPPPEGCEMTRGDAPPLFEMIDKTSAALNTPRPQHVLLNGEFNASIVSLPRWGGLASETYLNIGLPLMQALSPEQFRAVIAHEMGHLSSNHGSYSAWIYRLRESWARFLEFEQRRESNASFLYAKFLNWYFPYFNAYTFVLAREQEREADRCAVQVTNVKHAGEALINCELKAVAMQQNFWKNLLDEANFNPTPPREIFNRMALAFRQPSENSQEVLTLSKAISVRTDYSDTHPCLADRLTAMGYWKKSGQTEDLPSLPDVSEKSAADLYLGRRAEKFTKQLDEEWHFRVAEQWKARHEYMTEAQKRIDELNQKDGIEGLNETELYERACLVADKHGDQAALPFLQELILLHPKHAAAQFMLGSILLDDGDEAGIVHIKEAMKAEPDAMLMGNERIFMFLQRHGREEEAKTYLDKAENLHEVYAAAHKERITVTDSDNFEPAELPAAELRVLQERLSYHEELSAAYLVRKKVKNLQQHHCNVLCLEVKRKTFSISSGTLVSGISEQEFLEAVIKQVGELGIHFVLIFNKEVKGIERKVKKVPNSQIL
jgi:tetratricopeptide (TPR) repeat protein